MPTHNPEILSTFCVRWLCASLFFIAGACCHAADWNNKSGNTLQVDDILELVGDWEDVARAEIELDVEPGQAYVVHGEVKNSREGLRTYIGVLNGTENTEH